MSQSPYGAQSLATYEAGRPLHPYLSSQSPYGAQSLATPLRVPRVRGRRGSVAIPLRGSIPCNREAIRRVIAKAIEEAQSPYGAQALATCNDPGGSGEEFEGARRNPLTGLNPLQRERVWEVPRGGALRSRNPLTGLNPLQLFYPQATSSSPSGVAIPLRGSIPCNSSLSLASSTIL